MVARSERSSMSEEFGICSCPIPTSASNSNGLFPKELQIPETASASESASEIITGAPLSDYPGTTRQPLVKAGFAARRV